MLDELKKEWAEVVEKETGIPAEEVFSYFEKPKKEEMGDVALPCFKLAKQIKEDVKNFAERLKNTFSTVPFISSAEVVGGYLNLRIERASFTQKLLKKVLEEGENYGSSKEGDGKTVLIDFSSPNIAKPFGVGHLRSTVLGAALGRILQFLGYKVIGINYLGDWGAQVAKMMVAYQKWFDKSDKEKDTIKKLYELYVRFHKEEEENPHLAQEADKVLKSLEECEKKSLELWREFIEISMAEFRRIYEILGVDFDEFAGESMCDEKGAPRCIERMDSVIKELAEKRLLTEGEGGALIVEFDQKEKIPPLMMRKSDGTTLYATREVAVALERWRKYKFDRMLYVVGVPQKLHFQQVFRLFEMAGYPFAGRCEHIAFGHYLGMSTRRGTMVLLEEVLNELIEKARKVIEEKNPELLKVEDPNKVAKDVAVGALIFNDLKNERIKDVVYDEERFLSFDGETGPYLQYAHTRLCGILRKWGKSLPREFDAKLLSSDEEWRLVMNLSEFSRTVKNAAEHREPSRIANYLIECASNLNLFYQRHRVLCEENNLTNARISLVAALRIVLAKGLELLGIKPLERM
ncbi:MAG: arginine--tRNA ligase [Planctomycetota bacterium]|nr:arginine--tRNA ligase [Planctomycetota bacterium]